MSTQVVRRRALCAARSRVRALAPRIGRRWTLWSAGAICVWTALATGVGAFESRAPVAPVTTTGTAGMSAQDDLFERATALETSATDAAAQAFVEALSATDGPLTGAHQALGFRLGSAVADGGDLALAAELQVALHGRVAADWSAINAAITLMRAGRLDEAATLLAEHEPAASAPGDVANYRGLVAMARADVTQARRHFSRALVRGSRDASLSLARMDLLEGHPGRARAGFRPSLDDAAPHAWALRGWALTLLP